MSLTVPEILRLCRDARLLCIDMVERSGTGHIGSAFSIVEILAVLMGRCIDLDAEDRLVLSKGHGGLAFYAMAELLGWCPSGTTRGYLVDGGEMPAFPSSGFAEPLVFSSGSLGHGLSNAAGVGYGLRLRGAGGRVFAVLSDGECQEGSVWEAAQFIGFHALSNVVAVVDRNGLQAIDSVESVLGQQRLADRFRAFGWRVEELDGHDPQALLNALLPVVPERREPLVVIADTVKGKGVSFMENDLRWHYLPLDGERARAARREIEVALNA